MESPTMNPIWTQGTRKDTDDGEPNRHLPWQAVAWHRTKRSFDQLKPNKRTAEAESQQNWRHQAYFYVNRPHPQYSRFIHTFECVTENPESITDWRVSPFDTGGMLSSLITLDKTCTKSPYEIVEDYTWTVDNYKVLYWDWITEAYDEPIEYLDGKTPRVHASKEIDVNLNTDQAWTWEVRIPACDYSSRPETDLSIRAIYLTLSDHKILLHWIQGNPNIDPDDGARIMDFLSRVVKICESPFETLRSDLRDLFKEAKHR